MDLYRPKWFSGRARSRMSSVEFKVAQALADKEGIEQKRQQAIAEEAEKKRLKMAAAAGKSPSLSPLHPRPPHHSILAPISIRQALPSSSWAMPAKIDKTEFPKIEKTERSIHHRSIACQVTPKNIPGFQKLAYVGTESQYTGVHFRENYAAVRANYRIREVIPHLEVRPNERNLHGIRENLHLENPSGEERKTNHAALETMAVEEEEKYVGPRLHDGTIPEMVVGSGALGMTSQKKQRKRGGADEEESSSAMAQEKYGKRNKEGATDGGLTRRCQHCWRMGPHLEMTVITKNKEELEKWMNVLGEGFRNQMATLGPRRGYICRAHFPNEMVKGRRSASAIPATPQFVRSRSPLGLPPKIRRETPPEDEDPDWSLADDSKPSTSTTRRYRKRHGPVTESITESLLNTIESRLPQNLEKLESTDLDYETASEEERQKRLRYREIGRIICEMQLSDFPQDKTERRGLMIAHRGDDMLLAVRRNLAVIRDRLGEYAQGTIFDYVDELTDSFAEVTPNGLSRLNDAVTEKLHRREEGTIADALASISGAPEFEEAKMELREVKVEEVDVKVEEPDYVESYDF